MPTEFIDIVIRARGDRVVASGFDRIAQKAADATRAIFLLQRALFVLGAGAFLSGLQRISDTFVNIQNRLRLVTDSTGEMNAVMEDLFSVANRTRTAFEGTAQVYARTALSIRSLGISQKETIQFTESLNKAIILSGAGAQEANAALIQLGQGLASNRLSGDELRSVLEQLPFVADVIAKSIGATRGELRELGREGKLSAEVVLRAFREAREEIAEKFAQTIPTIGQAFTVLKNRLIEVVGAFNQNTGAASTFTNLILALARNLETLVNVLTVAIGLFAAIKFSNLIQGISGYTRGVVQNTQAQLANNTAKVQSIQAIVNERNARASLAATRVAELKADRDALAATAARNQRQLEQLTINTRLQRSLQQYIGEEKRVKAALEQQLASSRGLAATKLALAKTNDNLAAAEARLAAASSLAASGQARLAAAQGAITLQARLATAAIAGLNNVLAFFGGPIGFAITAVVTAVSLLAVRTTEAQRSTEQLERNVRDLAQAFEEVGGNADNLLKRLETLTLTRAIEDADEAARQFNLQLGQVQSQIETLTATQRVGLFSNLSEADLQVADQIDEIGRQFLEGSLEAEDFRNKLNEIAVGSDVFRPLVANFSDLVNELLRLEENSEKAEAIIRVLSGTATDADRELLGLEVAVKNTGDALKVLETAALNAEKTIEPLLNLSPIDREQAESARAVADAYIAYRDRLAQLNIELKKGEISTLDFLAEQQRLSGILKRGVTDVDGSTKATEKAVKSLEDYARANQLAALSERQRAISEATAEYQQLIATLIAAKSSQEDISEAGRIYVQVLNRLNAQFDAIDEDAIKKLGEKQTFDDIVEGLRRENEAIQRTIQGRSSLATIYQTEQALKRGLTDAEKALIIQLEEDNEKLRVQERVLKDILGPAADLEAQLEALDVIYKAGIISIDQYEAASRRLNDELKDLTTTADQVSQGLNSLARNIPTLAAQVEQTDKLAKAQKDYNDAIKALDKEERSGGITTETISTRIELNRRLAESKREIVGLAGAQRDAAESLKEFVREGELSTLDAKNRALAVQADAYAEITRELDKANASAEDRAAAAIANEQQIAAIEQRFAEKASKAAQRENRKFTSEDAIADLEREQQALINVIRGRQEYNELAAIEKRIKDELTPAQQETILNLIRENTEIDRQVGLLQDLSNEGPDILQTFTDLNALLDAGIISHQMYNQALQDNTFAWLEFKESIGEASFSDGFLLALEDMAFGIQDFTSEAGRLFGQFTETFANSFARTFTEVLKGTKSVRDALYEIANQALTQLIQGLIKLGIQYALNAALGQSLAAASTAAQSAQAAALAAAYAPAAAAVSLASYGANAPPAQAGMASTYALAQALSSAGGVPGFEHGGSIMVGGTGGIDSQLVALRASPNERIDVLTPSQQAQRDREDLRTSRGTSTMNQTNYIEINYQAADGEDPEESSNALAKEIADRLENVRIRDGV